MLHKLQQKHAEANVSQLTSNKLANLADQSCDAILSTLAMAHIENIEEAITEWNRVLKRTGEMLLTDYHPSNLAQGGQRTFSYAGRTVAVKNYIHSIDTIKQILSQLHLRILYFEEIVIDDRLKHYYTKQNALHVYEKHKGSAIIYGMHIKKEDAAS
jgi:ubiquinone/menaquinone biosynthesis C-methylase UbiE